MTRRITNTPNPLDSDLWPGAWPDLPGDFTEGTARDVDGPGSAREYAGFALPAGRRTQPVRGRADLRPLPGTHGVQVTNGSGVVQAPSEFERQQLVAEEMSEHLSQPQYQHAIWRRRGMPRKADAPDGTPGIVARQSHDYGLGPAYRGTADLGHDPGDTPVSTGYLHERGPSDDAYLKYVGASGLLAQPGRTRSWPDPPPASQFPTVTTDDVLGVRKK